jgi:esterase/lipase superfamily enzyme
MQSEYRSWFSKALHQDMALKIYGKAGKPALVFPTEGGRFFDFEDFGMLNACRQFVDEGKVRFYAVDSVDQQSWLNDKISPANRALRHEDYHRYIINEVVQFIRQNNPEREGGILVTGASMGGYHAGNFFFRQPDIFDTVITLSAMFQLRQFIGDYMDKTVYFNSPLHYLANLTDPWYLDRYRIGRIFVCVGRGNWETPLIADACALKNILDAKEVPCWVDFWGNDVSHDWHWWRKQLPYFLEHLFNPEEEKGELTRGQGVS